MVNYRFVAMAGMAGMVAALPLNINLGAYSPALVVGDGEISFGGKADVSNLMNALEGAAVNAASGAAGGAAGRPATQAPVTAQPAQPAPAAAAAQPAAPAAPAADPALQEQAQQIAALQGMGKSIAPRAEDDEAEEEEVEQDAEESSDISKRDITGFDRALRFAEAALTKGPKIQLGTGAEGSGVGIIVDNNQVAAARPGKGEAEKAEKAPPAREGGKAKVRRDVVGSGQRVKVTTMFVRSGIPASMQNSPELARRAVPVAAVSAPKFSSRSDALDAVNLNVDGDKGLTMTFVETVDDE
ncbi:hypothetical protein GGTG_00509 [Gaeumannomyces tritici R3-111a-1]|uniref:Uncharacterized protein n=1 Tax=Gaeumannomyces tritici (strain R3-111a-1) TaxID=644352 RepID=J3NGX3_GAET3|nr:hypothetical protein GGTG_00509 [Gaeumannomyces tritici R3-111a-1]EJT80513.1 hypothetical protein GGTG_00509 [Gaeumannomyces tritici R3-111a-1]